MRGYLNFSALVLLFAFAAWWFANHPSSPRSTRTSSSPAVAMELAA